jgi:hypothetical protein
VKDAYEIYCAWCLSTGRKVPPREWWDHFIAILKDMAEDIEYGEEIFKEIREETP